MYRAERRLCREIKKKIFFKVFSSLTRVFIKQPSYVSLIAIIPYYRCNRSIHGYHRIVLIRMNEKQLYIILYEYFSYR